MESQCQNSAAPSFPGIELRQLALFIFFLILMHEDVEEDDVVVFQSEAIIDFAYLSEEPREDRGWSRHVLQLSLTRGPATWGKVETRLILLLQLWTLWTSSDYHEHFWGSSDCDNQDLWARVKVPDPWWWVEQASQCWGKDVCIRFHHISLENNPFVSSKFCLNLWNIWSSNMHQIS